MNPIWGHVAGVVTVILMLTFIGIWIWAWRKKHKPVFDRMARLPLEDDSVIPAAQDEDERRDTNSAAATQSREATR